MTDQQPEPRYPHTRWPYIGDLMFDLMKGETPRPFWIQFDHYATKVTEQNKDSIAHGLHLALEFQMANDKD